MALDSAAMCKRAVKLESEQLRTIRMDPMLISSLKAWLLEVYEFLLPRPCDYEHRKVLVAAFNKIASDSFGNKNGFPIVEPFGSFVMDLFTAESDLDLSINFNSDYTTEYPRPKKVSELRKFTKFLYKLKGKGYISKVSPILQARVPVVKVVDSGTGIECDVSAENKDGISRTSILAIISSIDGRFRILSYLMKAWAKAHDINSSKDRTMNSLSIISLVAFHLQTQDPPILPPFSALFKDGTDVSSVQNAVIAFKHFGTRNEESIARLFVTLLIKLSAVESLWHGGLCASTYEGTWIEKKWKSGVGNMSVEDFLDRSQNFARAVGKDEFKKIYTCIKGSLKNLSRFMEGKIEETKFKEGLFGSFPLVTSSENFINEQQVDLKRSNPFHDSAIFDDIAVKRALPTEAIEEVQHDLRSAPADLAIFDDIAVKRARPTETIEEVQHDLRSSPADLAIFDDIAVKRARPTEAIEEIQHDFRSAPADLASSSIQLNPPTFQFQPSNQNLKHSKSVHQPRHSSQSSIPHSGYRSRHNPPLPAAPHSGYRTRHNPPLPTTPYSGYVSQHYSQLPSAPHSQFALRYNLQQPSAPNSVFRPQYNLQHPSAPNSGFRSQYSLQHPSAFNSVFPPWYNLQQPSAPNSGFRPQYHPQVPWTPPMGHGIEQQQFTLERNYLPNRRSAFPENGDGSLNKLLSTYSTRDLQPPKQPYVPPRWANGSDY